MLLVVSLMVWRVPNETSTESVARIWAAEISAIAAASAGSRFSPIVTSAGVEIAVDCWEPNGIDAQNATMVATRSGERADFGML